MSASIDTVIAELIDQRRAKQTEIQRIDEALIALQPFTETKAKAKRTNNISPEVRAASAQRMRDLWANRKANGLPMGRPRTVTPEPEPAFAAQ